MLKFIALGLLKFYQFVISPLLPKSCRFLPSCSEYSMQSFKKHGVWVGGLLTAKRLCSCHPFSKKEMVDEVPEERPKTFPFKLF